MLGGPSAGPISGATRPPSRSVGGTVICPTDDRGGRVVTIDWIDEPGDASSVDVAAATAAGPACGDLPVTHPSLRGRGTARSWRA